MHVLSTAEAENVAWDYSLLPFALLSAPCPVNTYVCTAAGHARLLGSKVPGKLPEVPALEKMYRKWFAGKSDVWRLCSDIVDIMDGRSWPIAQRKKVSQSADHKRKACMARCLISCMLNDVVIDI